MRSGQYTSLDSIVVRFGGEIGIKGKWTRRQYERLLMKNIYNTLKHCDAAYGKFTSRRGRLYIETEDAVENAARVARIFGVSSVSPAAETTSEMRDVVQVSLRVASETIKDEGSFAVRCHRVGQHAFSSMEVCKEVGSRLLTSLKEMKLHVDLTNPEFTIAIEIRDAQAYVFTDTLQGPGGFPVGSQSKVACLLSGGIDSPVACWLTMKRGCSMVPVYMDNTPLSDDVTTRKALEIAGRLFEWSVGYPRRVYVVPHGQNLQTFLDKSPRRLTCLLCKRMMYRIAERIADDEGAEGIVTGEAIGEQASQTLTNLRVLDEAARKYPVHRPLLGFDKTETTELSKKIGTYEISAQRAKGCCAAPTAPATKAKLEVVKQAEAELDIESMVHEAVRMARIVTV